MTVGDDRGPTWPATWSPTRAAGYVLGSFLVLLTCFAVFLQVRSGESPGASGSVIDVFNALNRDIGDSSITGLRHPFRLAGFRNFKDKHERDGKFPFVELVETVNRFCRKTWELVAQRQAQIEALERKAEERKPRSTPGRSFTR